MAKNKFLESLVKIAAPLFGYSMSDRYNYLDGSDETDTDTKIPEYTTPVDQAQLWKLDKEQSKFYKGPKFKTAPPAHLSMSPNDFDYVAWSKTNDFSSIAPHIVTHETGGNKLISDEANKDGTYDYGFYQINENNLDRVTSGGDLADAFDPIFDKYYEDYITNYQGKTPPHLKKEDYVYPELNAGGSKDVDNRKILLQIPNDSFNNVTSSLGYDLANVLYSLRGIGSWSTKDKVIESINNSNQVASK